MPWWNGSVLPGRNLALIAALAFTPAGADIAYVTCQNGEVVSVLDLDTRQTLTEWSVPGKPAGITVWDDNVFTISPDSKQVRRLNRQTGMIEAEVSLDGGPIGVALDAMRGRLFVSDWYNARIWVLDAATLAVQSELTVGAAPAGLALSDDGRFLASADRDADQVSLFDAETLDLLHQVTVGTRPFGLRYAPDGTLWVGNVGTNDVTVIEGATIRATVPVGARPYGVAFSNGRAFVTNQYEDTVSVIDLVTRQHLQKIDVGEYPEGIDTTSDGRLVVANWFENTISLIDPETLNVIDSIETGDGPRAFGVFVFGGDT